MKKNLISLAVAASVLGGAAAQAGQHINPNGTGQVLMFPFYNADNGNATNMHVVNTTDKVKALKVRFVEHKNSDEVLDFNVYLSPNDHFAFGVIKDPNGTGGAVITADNSCTVPALGSANGVYSGSVSTNAAGSTTRIQPFVNYQYAGGATPDYDSSIERSLTGHVEVIEMGVVSNVGAITDANWAIAGIYTQYASFATHGATGVPANCAGLVAAWGGSGGWTASAASGLSAPTGGLYGLAYHINVEAAAAYGFEPTAIDDWRIASKHTNPGTNSPSLADGVETAAIHHAAGGDQHIEVTLASGAEATSATLMTASISNDVMVNPAIGGMTDWVITFPTKRLHVDKGIADPVAPFTGSWRGIKAGTTPGTYKEQPACEPVKIGQWDREEGYTAAENGFSPRPTQAVSVICNEVAVIAVGPAGTASALSAETGVINLAFAYTEGWQQILFGQTGKLQKSEALRRQDMDYTVGNATLTEIGLPAIGFGAYKVNNGAMSYGNAAEHKNETLFSIGGGVGNELPST